MSARTDLLDRLSDEIAQGWPEPWWPQDLAASRPHQPPALERYIDIIGDLVESATDGHGHVIPLHREASPRVSHDLDCVAS